MQTSMKQESQIQCYQWFGSEFVSMLMAFQHQYSVSIVCLGMILHPFASSLHLGFYILVVIMLVAVLYQMVDWIFFRVSVAPDLHLYDAFWSWDCNNLWRLLLSSPTLSVLKLQCSTLSWNYHSSITMLVDAGYEVWETWASGQCP